MTSVVPDAVRKLIMILNLSTFLVLRYMLKGTHISLITKVSEVGTPFGANHWPSQLYTKVHKGNIHFISFSTFHFFPIFVLSLPSPTRTKLGSALPQQISLRQDFSKVPFPKHSLAKWFGETQKITSSSWRLILNLSIFKAEKCRNEDFVQSYISQL